jgi:GT2 family glycosyltransferase
MPSRTDDNAVLGPSGQRVHLLIATHTTRHLEACLSSIAAQESAPDTVVVTCDDDQPAIRELVERVWPRVSVALVRRGAADAPPPLGLVMRPHAGEPRLNQVRNNGLRAIVEFGARDRDLVVVIDGDMVLSPRAISRHRALAAGAEAGGADVVVPFRVNLDALRTARIDGAAFLSEPASWPAELTLSAEDEGSLAARDRRYRRQLLMRRVASWLTKPHKPKLLGGHHAVRLAALTSVNGYDEQFVGYGYDDDDLARRLHGLGGLRWAVAVRDIPAFHLWHPTRAPARPTDSPGFARFAAGGLPVRCVRGLGSPRDQAPPSVLDVGPRASNAGVPA